ncbi:hypothetical protein PQX77_022073 [Marasmius sp. AFHP31]|nr:hypothetical protein PQX77_022073 [Marasmius sp. AFHP31]
MFDPSSMITSDAFDNSSSVSSPPPMPIDDTSNQFKDKSGSLDNPAADRDEKNKGKVEEEGSDKESASDSEDTPVSNKTDPILLLSHWNTTVELVLGQMQLGAHKPLPIPFNSIKELEGVKITPSARCIVKECNWYYPTRQEMHNHVKLKHPEVTMQPKCRLYLAVDCQSTGGFRGVKRYMTQWKRWESDSPTPPNMFPVAENAQQKPVVLAITSWDLLLQDVRIESLRELVLAIPDKGQHLK